MTDETTIRAIPHGTLTGYARHRCRCAECRAAKAAYCRERGYDHRVGARAESKRRWDRENRPLCECGQPMSRGAGRCIDCKRRAAAAYRRLVETMWAEGITSREIGEALGWNSRTAHSTQIARLRASGWDLPPRRTPEQIARMTAGLAKARAKARASRQKATP